MADRPRFAIPAPAAPLVGRERELAALRDALASVLAGRGSLVLIGGEAGIGKTALAETICAEANQQGALVPVGRCYDLSETPPYGPWAEALARAPRGDALPTPPDLTGGGAASQAALFAAVREYLAALAAARPLALFLDDLHWADPASLDLLRFLGRQLADLPLLVLATYRTDELTRRHPLYALLPVLEREGRAARLDLRPLDEAATRALVGQYALPTGEAGRLTAWLVGRSEGNAFFITHLLRALEDDGTLRVGSSGWTLGDLGAAGLPTPLRQVLDARVDRLGEAGRELLALAALIGQEIPLALWATVAGTDEDDLLDTIELAVGARLLTEAPDGATVRFAHALIREALYEGVFATRRRRIHLRVGEALLATAAPDPDAVAYQFQRARDERAVAWLVKAGHRAASAHAYRTATARFDAALDLLGEDGDPTERAWLLFSRGILERHTDPRRAIPYFDAALELARALGDQGLLAHTLYFRSNALGMAGDVPQAITETERAVAAVQALAPAERERLRARGVVAGIPVWERDHRGDLGYLLAEAGRLREALALGEAILAEHGPVASGEPHVVRAAYRTLGVAHAGLGHPEAALLAYAEARDRYRLVNARFQAALMAVQALVYVVLPYLADDLDERRRAAALAVDLWGQAGEIVVLGYDLDTGRWPLLILEGAWGAVRQLLEAAARTGPAGWRQIFGVAAGRLALAQGEAGPGWQAVAAALPSGPATAPGVTLFALASDAQRLATALALDAGDLTLARTWLDAQARWLAWTGAVLYRAEWLIQEAEYDRAAGDPARAQEHAEAALAQAIAPRQPLPLLAARRLLGELAAAAGRYPDARAQLEQSLTLAEACAAPYERALTLLALAELHAVTGDHANARAALDTARALLEPLQARPALARAASLAATLAAPSAPPTADTSPPAGLSSREAEVLRLVARGLTNAQAAERLYLSPRTVDQHLRSVYNKLGVSSRAAAARWAAEHGLTGGAS